MTEEVQKAARMIWQYMLLHETPGPADCLLVLGSRDERVAAYAAELAKRYTYSSIVISGGRAHRNDLLATKWQQDTEAEHFAEVMRDKGVATGIHWRYKLRIPARMRFTPTIF